MNVADYRFKCLDKEGQLVLPCSLSNADRKLTLEGAQWELYMRKWCEFWYKEIKKLIRSGEIVRAILASVVYQDTERGSEAEKLLCSLLKERYSIES